MCCVYNVQDKTAEEKLQFCAICSGYKAPRSHHCRKCMGCGLLSLELMLITILAHTLVGGRCVKKMDHHCPWINTCVGWANHAYFTAFLAFAVAGSLQATVVLCGTFYRGMHRSWYLYHGHFHLATVQFALPSLVLCVFALGLAVGVVVAVGMLLVLQLRGLARNRTGIEDWILEKAKYRRYEHEPDFVFPYDLGSRRRNFAQVLSRTCAPFGDGIAWTTRDDCDQFTLTVEQIAQKAEKRARTRTYTIRQAVSGRWLPLWSQGWTVSCSPPCTDEPRIRLVVGDVVRVSRWKT